MYLIFTVQLITTLSRHFVSRHCFPFIAPKYIPSLSRIIFEPFYRHHTYICTLSRHVRQKQPRGGLEPKAAKYPAGPGGQYIGLVTVARSRQGLLGR
jgi:hypothetical protein